MLWEDFGYEDIVCVKIEEAQKHPHRTATAEVLQDWVGLLIPYQHSFTECPSCGAGEAQYALGMLV